MIFTDPPYNVNFSSTTPSRKKIVNDNLPPADFRALLSNSFCQMKRAALPSAFWYICCNWASYHQFYYAISAALRKIHTIIVWVKDSPGLGQAYRNQHEFIVTGGDTEALAYTDEHEGIFFASDNPSIRFTIRTESNVWCYPAPNSFAMRKTDNAGRQALPHPTMKPVALIARAIHNSSRLGDRVLDLFLGSGSTLIACEQTGRICFGTELDPVYCDVIVTRYCEFTGRRAVVRNGITMEWPL
jgi:DNA modification methylase